MSDKPKASSNEYKREYRDNHYDQIGLSVPKGLKQEWKDFIKEYGIKSLNTLVIDAVSEKMDRMKKEKAPSSDEA